MSRSSNVSFDTGSAEQRRLPRKNVLLGGVIAGLNGEDPSDCVIRDMTARGAAVSVAKPIPRGSQIYLVDTATRSAHLARVAWSSADRVGLTFIRSYVLGFGLPPSLYFLFRLLYGAKLAQAERAVAMGIAPQLALDSVGFTREHFYQIARHARADQGFAPLLYRAKRLFGR